MGTLMGIEGCQHCAVLKTWGSTHPAGKSDVQEERRPAESLAATMSPDKAGEGNSRNCRGLLDLLCI